MLSLIIRSAMKQKILLGFVLFSLFASTGFCAEAAREIVVKNITGTVEYQKGGEGDWIKATNDLVLAESDIVRTGDKSSCDVVFKGQSDAGVEMRPNSILEFTTVADAKGSDDTELDLMLGSVLVKAEKLKGESSFKVRTPNSIVGIRGTEFEVKVD